MPRRLLLPLLGLVAAGSAPAYAQPAVAITNVTVIDVADGTRRPTQNVFIRNGRITEVAAAGRVTIPATATRIDGRGKFLMPGLWDMHVHALRSTDRQVQGNTFALFIANGVTGIRDMGSMLDTVVAVRGMIGQKLFEAVPRVLASGPLLDGPKFRWSQAVAWHVENPDDARRAVDSLRRAGVDFLKVYTSLSRETYLAVAAEARRVGLPFAGHIPFGVSAEEASIAGQASLEHNGMWVHDVCVDGASRRIGAALNRWGAEGYAAWFAERRAFHAARDAGRCAELRQTFRRNGTWMVPTMVMELKDRRALARPAFTFLDSLGRKACEATVASIEAVPDALRTGFFADFVSEVVELHRDGVRLLAGSDLPNPCLVAGFSLHDELAELVGAGLTPHEALVAATLGPAEFLHLTDSLGTIETGKLADLVLLDADPLLDIANTRRIRAVIANGRVFDRAALDAMLARARPR